MEIINIHATDSQWGMALGKVDLSVHERSRCEGEFCCIHNPSDHPLKEAELNWRADRRIMERLCECGVGHPDPDDLRFRVEQLGEDPEYAGIHGCCGCCFSEKRV